MTCSRSWWCSPRPARSRSCSGARTWDSGCGRPPSSRSSRGSRACGSRGWGRLRLPRQTLVRNLLIAAVLGLVLFAVSVALDPFNDLRLATGAYLFTALAGLTVLTGMNGQISLGHGALMAVGAYAMALLVGRHGWALVPAL